MKGKFVDLTGQKFGKLTVIKRAPDRISPSGSKRVIWECQCDCGNEKHVFVSTSDLNSGHTKLCGCIRDEALSERSKLNIRSETKYNLDEEYGIGYTNNGDEFYFDIEDYDKIKQYNWQIDDKGYVRSTTLYNGKSRIKLHRVILGLEDKPEYDVDHIGHNLKDNRKSQLRVVKDYQNLMNTRLSKNNTSGVKGVSYDKNSSKWCAYIQVNNKYYYLGRYDTKEEAIQARKKAEEKLQKEYSYDSSMKYAKQYKIEDEQCAPMN